MTMNEYERLMSEACDKLAESQMEVGRLRTALETVLNYSNDPSVVKMVEYALAQAPVRLSVSSKER